MASIAAVRTVPSTGGVTLAVHDLGGDGRDALLAHATGFHGLVWQPLASELTGLRCVAPDLRAHGGSPVEPGADLSWDRFADDVLATVDALGLTDVLGVGHSMGGAALLLAEQRRPGTFRALHLFEPIAFPSRLEGAGRANPLAEGALRRRSSFPSRQAAYDNYAGKPPFDVLCPSALRAYVDHGLAEGPDGAVHLRCRPADEAEVFRQGSAHHAFDHLGEVACPVTVARGALHPLGPAALADLVVERLPRGQLEALDDLGHLGPLEQPEVVARSVERSFGLAPGSP